MLIMKKTTQNNNYCAPHRLFAEETCVSKEEGNCFVFK